MATILGTVGNEGWGSSVALDVSGIAASNRIGIVCAVVNGPSQDPAGNPHTVSGFTEAFSSAGSAYKPGISVHYGSLSGLSTIDVTSTQAQSSSAVVFAIHEDDFDSGSLSFSSISFGYASAMNSTIPNQGGEGGWIGIMGTNNSNEITECFTPTPQASYDSGNGINGGVHAHAGGIPSGGFNSEPITIQMTDYGSDNISYLTLSWLDSGGGPAPTAPGAPTSVTATSGNGQVSLSWSPPASDGGSAITGYDGAYKLNSDGTWTSVGTITSTHVFSSLTNGSPYDFRVRAVNVIGDGPWVTAAATPTGGAATVPATPTNVVAVAGDGEVDLSWTLPSNGGSPITDIGITYQTVPDGGWSSPETMVGSSATAYTVTGLSNGTEYEFSLYAENAVGISGWSDLPGPYPRATPVASGGGPAGDWAIQYNLGNIQMIDWWEWSWDPANNDEFGVKARASGPEYYCSPYGSGSQNGTAGNPWSAAQMKSQVDNRLLSSNAIVHMAAGDYPYLGQFTGGGNGGWVTLLGPPASVGVAKIEGNHGRYWSMAPGSSRIQFVRLAAIHSTMNTAFNTYVEGGGTWGGQGGDDAEMESNIGANPGVVGFQLDGWTTPIPAEMVTVSCHAKEMGEGYGSYLAGNYFALGCLAEDCAVASPGGRSAFSFSHWDAGGYGHENSALIQSQDGLTDFYMGTFACVASDSAQFVETTAISPETGQPIGPSDTVTDGNGFNLPTDRSVNSGTGINSVQQCNIAINSGSAGFNGYNGIGTAGDELHLINNTSVFAGTHSYHKRGIETMGIRTGLVQGSGGSGMPFLLHRYQNAEGGGGAGSNDYYVHGNVAIHDPGASDSGGVTLPVYDTAWELFFGLPLSEVDEYFSYLAGKGFSGLWASVLPLGYSTVDAENHALTALNVAGDNVAETSGSDIVLTTAHINHIIAYLDKAQSHGIELNPLPAWANNNVSLGSGDCAQANFDWQPARNPVIEESNAYAYGQSVANGFGTHPAIGYWVLGGDDIWECDTAQLWINMRNGLKTADSGQPTTYHTGGDYNKYRDESWNEFLSPQTGWGQNTAQLGNLKASTGKYTYAAEMRYYLDTGFTAYGTPAETGQPMGSIAYETALAYAQGVDAMVYGDVRRAHIGMWDNLYKKNDVPYISHIRDTFNSAGEDAFFGVVGAPSGDPQPCFVRWGDTYNEVVLAGNRGNVSTNNNTGGVSTVIGSNLIEIPNRNVYAADLRPKAGSAAIGEAYAADLIWDIDFMGLPFVDRGGGRVDAGVYGGAVSLPPATVASAPTGLGATPGDGEVGLVWSAPVDDGGSAITGYEIEYQNLGSLGWISSGFADGRAWVVGDIHHTDDTDLVFSMINGKWQAGDVMVFAGDCIQENETAQLAPGEYAQMIAATCTVLGLDPTNTNEVLAAPGNHDNVRSAFGNAFGLNGTAPWFMKMVGGARWLVLDSCDPNDYWQPGSAAAQETWLDGILATPHDGPTYAVMHHPRRSSYTAAGYSNITEIDPIHQKLYNAEVDYIFCGHAPFFETTEKIDNNWYLRPLDGYRQIMVGTGGWSHASDTESDSSLMNATGPTFGSVIVHQETTSSGRYFGACLVEWSGTTSTYTYFSTDGVGRHTLPDDPLNNISTTGLISETSATISPLINGENYEFRVRAVNAVGSSDWSTTATASPSSTSEDRNLSDSLNGGDSIEVVEVITAPAQPTSFTATDTGNGIAPNAEFSLSWTAPSDGGTPITNYRILWRDPANNWYSELAGLGTTYLKSLPAGIEYDFAVAAINDIGQGPSSSLDTETGYSLPLVPQNLQGTSQSGQVVITWAAPTSDGASAITGYEVEYRENGSGTWLSRVGGDIPLGDLRIGVICTDSATYSGWIMWSEEPVNTRLGIGSSYAEHFIGVTHDNGRWQYDNNSTLIDFNPEPSDLLVWEIDTDANTATSLEGTNTVINGIKAGYGAGDLVVIPEQLGGSSNVGEFDLEGTYLTGSGSLTTDLFDTVTGLTNGQVYDFRVAAVNGVGTGAFTNPLLMIPSADLAAFVSGSGLIFGTIYRPVTLGDVDIDGLGQVAVGDFSVTVPLGTSTIAGDMQVNGTITSPIEVTVSGASAISGSFQGEAENVLAAYDGASWQFGPLKYWDGAAWITVTPRAYDGADWS